MFLSIITPTYNRAYTLKRLYFSLIAQSDLDFEWIVINDGSTDQTEELIETFQQENKIWIRYIYQENGGKQRAHNKGIQMARGELSVCVDSDDALSSNAVERAKQIWSKCNKRNHIGILAKRGDFKKHNPICGDWPDRLKECTMIGLQEQYGFSGDTVLFFKTDLIREHPFAEFEGEKFVPEDSLYADLDAYGTMILSKEVLYYCEYLPDGLTTHYCKLLLNNPMGTSFCYYRKMLRSEHLSNRFKNAIISQAFLIYSGRKTEYHQKGHAFVMLMGKLCAPLYLRLKKMTKEKKSDS